jgi:hypothetical protein
MEEERIELSAKERERLKVLHEITHGHLLQIDAARRLRLSDRQVRRLLQRLGSEAGRKWSEVGRKWWEGWEGWEGVFVKRGAGIGRSVFTVSGQTAKAERQRLKPHGFRSVWCRG